MTNFWQKRQYYEDSTEVNDLAHRGLIFLISPTFNINALSSIYFALTTGAKVVEFQFYDITSSSEVVEASIYENPTSYTGSASGITPRNLNRNYSDTCQVVLESATSVVGGTFFSGELVGSGAKAGGTISNAKVHSLLPNETYILRFDNLGNQITRVHMNLGWSEGLSEPPSLIDPD